MILPIRDNYRSAASLITDHDTASIIKHVYQCIKAHFKGEHSVYSIWECNIYLIKNVTPLFKVRNSHVELLYVTDSILL